MQIEIISKKIKYKLKRIYSKIFSYPVYKYSKGSSNKYWQTRKKSYLKITPNDFQIIRALIIKKSIPNDDDSILFDIGSGDGAQLIEIRKNNPYLSIFASDKDPYAIALTKKLKFKTYKLGSENDIFSILEEIKPNYISIFEVLEHMSSPEEFLLKILNLSNNKIFFSVPNSGYINHRLRFLFGRFPLQWIASPKEHLRFWTYKDMQWWLRYLQLFETSKIIPYKGMPFINKIFPNLFSEGILVIINNNN